MKSRIFICIAAAAAIIYAGCSLIKNEAAQPGQTDDNLRQSVSSSENVDSSDEQPAVSLPPEDNEYPQSNAPTEPAEPENTEIVEKSDNSEIIAVTTGNPDNDDTKKQESDEPTAPVTAAPDDVENSSKTESEENGIDKDYMYQTDDDFFFVVNKQLLLPEDYDIKLDYVQGDYKMEVTAAKYMRDMIAAAKEDGIELKILSTYRTVKYQKNLFERNVKSRMEKNGMSYEDAYYDTSINIAPPGGSEHNAGLAADIITKNDWDTYEAFEDTEEFAWLQEHAWEYGYILRYLKGKEDITGYIYEPWHYRYVGVKYAKTVRDSGLCLEEYFEKYVWADGSEPFFPWNNLV